MRCGCTVESGDVLELLLKFQKIMFVFFNRDKVDVVCRLSRRKVVGKGRESWAKLFGWIGVLSTLLYLMGIKMYVLYKFVSQ